MSTFDLRVEQMQALTPRVRRLVLARPDGSPLPPYTPGAHLEFAIRPAGEARTLHRAYSLVTPWDGGGYCEIAVQLESGGAGGSRHMHGLQVGSMLKTAGPRNLFELGHHAQPALLLAAGIGVTPILCMARLLQREAADFELHYVARDPGQAAYAEEVAALPGARCWFDGGEPSRGLDLAQILDAPAPQRHLYVCGPKGFIAAALETARSRGWPDSSLHYELFSGSVAPAGERPFTVVLAASGRELPVPVGRSVMDVLQQAGLDPLSDCRRGECGICVAKVLQGQAEHRDICLSPRDHEAGLFCTCVSRARSERLVLEL